MLLILSYLKEALIVSSKKSVNFEDIWSDGVLTGITDIPGVLKELIMRIQ